MPRLHQTGITLPSDLWNRVKSLPLGELGYASPTELVKDAIREKCEALEARLASSQVLRARRRSQ